MESKTVPVGTEGTEVNGGGSGSTPQHDQLLLGFPNDLTLAEVAPKLPWKTLWSLASANPAWLRVMRNREVYNGRVTCRTLESLVLLRFESKRIGLYSIRDGFYCDLPALPIPELTISLYRRLPLSVRSPGIPNDCQCVTADGIIYALGGQQLDYRHVYALDLAALDFAGPMQWKQCASMLRRKMSFGCVALDGKVYAIADDFTNAMSVSEVYDPKADTWSVIECMPNRQCLRLCEYWPIAVGEETFILSLTLGFQLAFTADIYHPLKDEWKVVRLVPLGDESFVQNIFELRGKLFWMRDGGIFVLDFDTGRWMLRHLYAFAGLAFLRENDYRLLLVKAVGDELVAVVETVGVGYLDEVWVLASEGFGGTNIDISWYESKLCPSYFGSRSPLRPIPREMHPMEL